MQVTIVGLNPQLSAVTGCHTLEFACPATYGCRTDSTNVILCFYTAALY